LEVESSPIDAHPTTNTKSTRGWIRIVIFIALVSVLFVAARFLPLKDYFAFIFQWVDDLGIWGPVVVAVSYIVACVLLIPGSILTLGAGLLFKIILGTVTVSIGSTLGASAAFLVGRTVGRDWVARKVTSNPKFAAIDTAVGHEGFKIVLLTRLSPVFPFVLLNYAYGLTKVKFRDYFLASWIGMLPGTVMYVYLGSGLRDLADALSGKTGGGTSERIFFWIGLAITIAVAVFVTRIARRALKTAVEKEEVEE